MKGKNATKKDLLKKHNLLGGGYVFFLNNEQREMLFLTRAITNSFEKVNCHHPTIEPNQPRKTDMQEGTNRGGTVK